MMIKVERGNPTPEELAAVVALVQARAAASPGPADGPRPADEWAAPARNVPSRPLRPAPVAWRATYWPH
ncbi:acyl-CoA carboxylase subunit epsilon [Streptomyces sp. NPDC002574]|uniref:acyl-CoA carboxylase subunit epsilon n=1 Tax=Streptomyces sp. NPDC002574 TaxID=3364652 RepID=UPI0036756D04